MAGSAATNNPVMPPAPVAAACMILFSCGPNCSRPRKGTPGAIFCRILMAPNPNTAPIIDAPKVKPVLRPEGLLDGPLNILPGGGGEDLPKYTLEALTSEPRIMPTTRARTVKGIGSSGTPSSGGRGEKRSTTIFSCGKTSAFSGVSIESRIGTPTASGCGIVFSSSAILTGWYRSSLQNSITVSKRGQRRPRRRAEGAQGLNTGAHSPTIYPGLSSGQSSWQTYTTPAVNLAPDIGYDSEIFLERLATPLNLHHNSQEAL